MPAIAVQDLHKSYGAHVALRGIDFEVGHGEVVGFLGPNGAGKTTFMDIITGKTKPEAGYVKWGAKNINLIGLSEAKIAQLGVGRKFQKPTVFEEQSVKSNLLMSLKKNRSPFSVLWSKTSIEDEKKIKSIVNEIGLSKKINHSAGELSHGQKQWLEIGMLLAQEPQLLLVDEPAAGMSPIEREHTTKLLLKAAETRAVVVVEHDMEFIRRLNCRVTVLHEGSVLAEGSLDHVTSNQDVIDVYLGR